MDWMTHYFAYCLTSLPLLSNRTHCDSIPLVFGAVDIDGKSRKIRSSGPKKVLIMSLNYTSDERL